MAGRPIAAYQIFAGCLAVLLGDVEQLMIISLQPGYSNNADVHHDVDEDRIRRQERAQILAPSVEPSGHRLPALDDYLAAGVVAGQLPPLLPGRTQYETKIMNLVVVLTFLDELAVVLGARPPLLPKPQLVEQPHLTAEEAFAPVGPGFLAVLPAALVGVEREVVGMVGGQPLYFASGDIEGGVGRGLGRLAERQGAAFLHLARGPIHWSLPHFSPTPPTQEGAWGPVRMMVLLCSMYSSIAVRPSSRPMPKAP